MSTKILILISRSGTFTFYTLFCWFIGLNSWVIVKLEIVLGTKLVFKIWNFESFGL